MSDFHDHHGDQDYGQDRGYEWEGHAAAPRRRRGLLSLGIVAAAVGAFCLLIWFVYTQGRRAGTEAVAPVIHADPGPTKVKPESPGGMDIPNQDRLIYDRLRADDKTPDDGVEHLLPPPETPMARPEAPPVAAPAAPGTAPSAATGPAAPGSTPTAPVATGAAAGQAVPVMPPQAVVPATQIPRPPQVQTPQTESRRVEAPKPEVARPEPSPAALPRTESRAAPLREPARPEAPRAEPPRPEPVRPTAKAEGAPVGAMRVQFASVPSDAQALEEVQRIQRKHAAVLGGVTLHVVRADLGAKGVYYRVQAGPMDEAQARRLCAAIKAGGDNCIPVH